MAGLVDITTLQETLKKRIEDVPPLVDDPDFLSNPNTLARFLKAREYNLDEAEKLLRAAIEWRREHKPRAVDCRWCHERPGIHAMRQVGSDELMRPVIYSCFAQAATRRNTVEDTLSHVVHLIENAKKLMPPGVHSWVFIIDCTGMTLPACNPKLCYELSHVMSDIYPERLGHVICINHKPLFQGVWKAISTFLHPNTVRKVHLERSKAKITELFRRFFSEELVTWLLEEIALNKKKPLPESQRRFWERPVDGGSAAAAHDPRGCPSYVREHLDGYVVGGGSGDPDAYQPHPNIVDELTGNIPDLPRTKSNLSEAADDLDDDPQDESEIQISEEYQIPHDASSLHM